MKKAKWLLLLVVFAMVVAACGDDDDATTTTAGGDAGGTETTAAGGDAGMVDVSGTEFTLLGAPVGDEGKAMEGFLNVYNAEKGTNISFTGSDDIESQLRIRVEGGDPPEWSRVGRSRGLSARSPTEGELASLEDMDFDIAQLEEDQSGSSGSTSVSATTASTTAFRGSPTTSRSCSTTSRPSRRRAMRSRRPGTT